MGFDELGRSSMKSNRSLIRSTLTKYFRNARGFAVGEKTELSAAGTKIADRKRHRKEFFVWMMLIGIIVAVIICAIFLL